MFKPENIFDHFPQICRENNNGKAFSTVKSGVIKKNAQNINL